MAKKRKAGGRAYGHDESRKTNDAASKLRINTYEDVADSEDEFHIERDKVLLEEGPAQKRQRKLREEGVAQYIQSIIIWKEANALVEEIFEPSDEEVLAASELDSDSEDDFEDAEEGSRLTNGKSKPKGLRRAVQDSGSEESAAPEEDEDAAGWGTSRKDYYNADTIETEADALEEEAEARRLQQKQLQGMTEADFGFDELEWKEAGKDDEDEDENSRGRVIREILPKLEITESMGAEERLKILRTRYPEFEPLAKEFRGLQTVHEDLKTAATEAVAIQDHMRMKADGSASAGDDVMAIAVVKLTALGGYLAALSMYFALFTSPHGTDGKVEPMPPEELRDHPIMDTLVQCRDLWLKVQDIVVPDASTRVMANIQLPHATENANGHFEGEELPQVQIEEKPKKKKQHKSRAQKAAEAAQAEADAHRIEQLRKTEEELAGLSALTSVSKPSSKLRKTSATNPQSRDDDDSDFGEQRTLTAYEAAEKAKRKKSLRFYTSQIAQKSNKRGAAGRDAGGDADIPYRERLKDRQARLNVEAEARGKKPKSSSKGDDLGGPSDEEDHAVARELREGAGSGSEDYYDLVASRLADKKAAKAALAAAHAQAAKEGGLVRVVDNEMVGEDGKRGISYQVCAPFMCHSRFLAFFLLLFVLMTDLCIWS